MNVLHVASPDAAKFANERAKLFAVREKRVRPHRDEKVLTAWNGLMISALSRAAQALDEPKYRARGGARRALSRGQSAEGRPIDTDGDGAGDGGGLRVPRQWPR